MTHWYSDANPVLRALAEVKNSLCRALRNITARPNQCEGLERAKKIVNSHIRGACPTMQRIDYSPDGDWVCVCGNTPHYEGFHAFDIVTLSHEDAPEVFYRCDRCGRVIDEETLCIIGRVEVS